jgi:hypothetical protein|tara:strand:+ start:2529 stop:2678 length:150 start_codon:yes stop_codon:yes gene_type:complete
MHCKKKSNHFQGIDLILGILRQSSTFSFSASYTSVQDKKKVSPNKKQQH